MSTLARRVARQDHGISPQARAIARLSDAELGETSRSLAIESCRPHPLRAKRKRRPSLSGSPIAAAAQLSRWQGTKATESLLGRLTRPWKVSVAGAPAVWTAGPDRRHGSRGPSVKPCRCRVLVGSLQRGNGLTLTVEATLPALNAQLGILYKMFQGRAGHAGA